METFKPRPVSLEPFLFLSSFGLPPAGLPPALPFPPAGFSTTPRSRSASFFIARSFATSALITSSVALASPSFLAVLSAATAAPCALAAASAAAISSGEPCGGPISTFLGAERDERGLAAPADASVFGAGLSPPLLPTLGSVTAAHSTGFPSTPSASPRAAARSKSAVVLGAFARASGPSAFANSGCNVATRQISARVSFSPPAPPDAASAPLARTRSTCASPSTICASAASYCAGTYGARSACIFRSAAAGAARTSRSTASRSPFPTGAFAASATALIASKPVTSAPAPVKTGACVSAKEDQEGKGTR